MVVQTDFFYEAELHACFETITLLHDFFPRSFSRALEIYSKFFHCSSEHLNYFRTSYAFLCFFAIFHVRCIVYHGIKLLLDCFKKRHSDFANVLKILCNTNDFAKFHVNILLDMILRVLWLFYESECSYRTLSLNFLANLR